MNSQATFSHPAIGLSIDAGGIRTNYHDAGKGYPVVLLHGSGAGITGWENWHDIMPRLAERYRVLVPDIIGFGFTERPEGTQYKLKLWVQHLLDFLDALHVEKAVLIGNSFGGALALALAMRNAHRVERLILMGTPAGDFERRTTDASSWYYEPSLENMTQLLRNFPYDPSVVTEDMVRLRHEVTVKAGGLEAYRKLFPEPGKVGDIKIIKGIPESDLEKIDTPVLVLHGRDDKVVPPECGLRIARSCPNAELHMFGKCGHWVQIEKYEQFLAQTNAFIGDLA
ncbi:MAG: alpha/beta hydrolase [Pseudomonadota bacterium]